MLHKALKYLRRYHNIQQQELALQLGISNSYLSEIESGAKAHAITVDLLERYSIIFGIPVSTIMLFSEQIDPLRRSEKLRVAMASKVTKILEWIDAKNEQAETPS
jgi:transcriptional regulator with XRE-family HTH domain